ncbi:hypothetical protein [Halopiger goleimassiliensis]|uniref:hypothetical protein n=1 Tax=Halopiger goleimassiliensis TaxID=1293048 RepID=UPI000677EACB|nr:hypothetical protein [Halopiger goleimassiliensis]
MATETHDHESDAESRRIVEYNEAVGYSALYAMLLATCAFTNATLEADVSPDVSLAMGYFVRFSASCSS